jgi:hypothetical protein
MSQGSSKSPDLILFPFEKSGPQILSVPRLAPVFLDQMIKSDPVP